VQLVSHALHWIKAEIHKYILKNWPRAKPLDTVKREEVIEIEQRISGGDVLLDPGNSGDAACSQLALIEYGLSRTGLGTTISILSMLVDSKQPIRLHASKDSVAFEIKSIFGLPNIELCEATNIQHDLVAKTRDRSKYFSPYLTSNTINVLGQKFQTRCRPKKGNLPCIGLALSQNGIKDVDFDNLGKVYPENRYPSMAVYTHVLNLILKSGYDVITIDSHGVSLEQKVYMMSQLCDAVIAYEGGAAHLAHMLDIPTIIFPWQYDLQGNKLGINYIPHTHHVDKKTYFLSTQEEILSWGPKQLARTIRSLYKNKGNNFLFNDDIVCSEVQNYRKNPEMLLTDFEQYFISTFIKGTKNEPSTI